MAEYNNNNATYFKPNTEGITMFSENMMLRLSYYDESMKIELRQKNMEGKYPAPEAGKAIDILLNTETVSKIVLMLDEFDKKLDERNELFLSGADVTGIRPYSISVYTGTTPERTKLLQISTGECTDHGFIPEIYLHIGVDENRVALNSYMFKTRVSPVLVDYDSKTGAVTMVNKLGQYNILDAAFRNFVPICSKGIRHFNKTVVNDEKLNKMENLVKLIADHFNIHLPEYNGNKSETPFDSFNSNTFSAPPPVVENGGDLGTLLGAPNYN
jgi:hypothetical protein